MNGRTSRSRDAATPETREHDATGARSTHYHGGRDDDNGNSVGSRRRRGHDPVPGEVAVDGAPMAVDRCRDCGIVVLDPGRPGGPCSGPNHTLTEFGVVPPADGEREAEPPAGRLTHGDHHGETDQQSEAPAYENANRRDETERRDGTDTENGTAPLLTSR